MLLLNLQVTSLPAVFDERHEFCFRKMLQIYQNANKMVDLNCSNYRNEYC